MRELKELEKRIGYHFQNPELLEKACLCYLVGLTLQ